MQINDAELDRVLAGKTFGKAGRMASLLRYLVAHGRRGDGVRLKETEIGTAVYGREVGYDPKTDSIVRVEATRLRKKLTQYYENEGAGDRVWMRLPAGRYELEYFARPETAAPAGEGPVRIPRWWAATLAVVAAGGLGFGVWRWTRPGTPVGLEGRVLTSMTGYEESPAVTRDGRMVAYTFDGGEAEKAIYVQALGEDSGRKLTGGGGVEGYPAWSADGKRIAYLRWAWKEEAEIRIREVASGKEETAGRVKGESVGGLAWSPDGRWLLAGEGRELVLFDREKGERRTWGQGKGSRSAPAFSPSGKRVAYLESEEASIGDVWVADFPGGAARRVTFDRTQVRGLCWQGEDALLVASYRERGRSGIWRVELATGRMERWTEATSESRTPAYAAEAGVVVWSRHVGNIHIWRRGGDWKSAGEAWIRATGLNTSPQYSPDGKRVALRSNRSGRSEIWVVEAETGAARRLTSFNGPVTGSPRWSPDGKRVAFDSRVHGKADIFVVDVDGGRLERVTTAESNEVVPGWSADGKSLYFASDRGGGWSLWRRSLETGAEERVRASAFAGFEIGDWVYFTGGPEKGGLYRMPKGGGQAEAVVAGLRASMWANWAVTREGLVWVEEGADGAMRLRRRTGAGVEEDLGDAGSVVRWDGGLAVSPDGGTLLLARLSGGDADLYVATAR